MDTDTSNPNQVIDQIKLMIFRHFAPDAPLDELIKEIEEYAKLQVGNAIYQEKKRLGLLELFENNLEYLEQQELEDSDDDDHQEDQEGNSKSRRKFRPQDQQDDGLLENLDDMKLVKLIKDGTILFFQF